MLNYQRVPGMMNSDFEGRPKTLVTLQAGLWDLGKSTAGAACTLEPGWERENRWNICVQLCSCFCVVLVTMLMGHIIFNEDAWCPELVDSRCHFDVSMMCSYYLSIPRMGHTSCCHNYEIMCQSYNQWEFQDPKLEVPTIYKAYIRAM